MNLENVGQLLRRLRKEKGLTQQQIGDKLNISAKTVSKWECGCGFPDVSVLKELSEILDVNINIILSGDLQQNNEETGNMKKNRLLCMFRLRKYSIINRKIRNILLWQKADKA